MKASRPLMVQGGLEGAVENVSFTFISKTLQTETAILTQSISNVENCDIRVSMPEYIKYVTGAGECLLTRIHEAGRFVKAFYAYQVKPFQNYPALREHLQLPRFTGGDWVPRCHADFRNHNFPANPGWLLVGPAGTSTGFHQDGQDTMTWLGMIHGSKIAYLVSPDHSQTMKSLGQKFLDNPDFDQISSICFTCELKQNTQLFLPPGWWHHVVSLKPSITVSDNFVNDLNFFRWLWPGGIRTYVQTFRGQCQNFGFMNMVKDVCYRTAYSIIYPVLRI